jgi:nitrate reductase NapD
MNISGVLIHVPPDEINSMEGKLADMPGVDVHTSMPDGKIIITIEDTPANVPSDTLMNVQNTPGIISAALVYNYNDDQLSEKEK